MLIHTISEDLHRWCNQVSLTQLWFLIFVVVFCIYYAGLDPLEVSKQNDVYKLGEPDALVFPGNGVVYADLQSETLPELELAPFSLFLDFVPASLTTSKFYILFSYHSGDDNTQFVVGQWQHQLVIMNGDDYNYARRLPRLVIDLRAFPRDRLQLIVNADSESASVYINGNLVTSSADKRLVLPSGIPSISLGNSVNLNQPWRGVLYQANIYPWWLDDKERLQVFSGEGDSLGSYQLLNFSEETFDVPAEMSLLTPRFFADFKSFRGGAGVYWRDVILNLLGFIPLGFLMMLALCRHWGQIFITPLQQLALGRLFLLAGMSMAVGFIISLSIEYQQAWLLQRHSSWLDLLLNSAGTLIGTVGMLGLFLIHPDSKFSGFLGNNRSQ